MPAWFENAKERSSEPYVRDFLQRIIARSVQGLAISVKFIYATKLQFSHKNYFQIISYEVILVARF